MTDQEQAPLDPTEHVDLLLRHLRAARRGLSQREAERRLVVFGRNELTRHAARSWLRELVNQLIHPLALLLWAAAALAVVAQNIPLAVVIVAVILLNAVFAFVQERHAERTVEAMTKFLPVAATVLRDGSRRTIDASELVPGDVILIREGDGISADARLIDGSIEAEMATLTGESAPVMRSSEYADHDVPLLEARELVFSGTTCTRGEAWAVVFSTGMHTELGRIAALAQRVDSERSPLEGQVRRVAWIIAAVAVAAGIAFLPLGTFAAGLPFEDSVIFSIGLLVANVPEGLLPTITLALAFGVRVLARRRALVKRLSAVETLGCATVICTDKTGTLTENRMTPKLVWTLAGEFGLDGSGERAAVEESTHTQHLGRALAACSDASLERGASGDGDPTEVALLQAADRLGAHVDVEVRERDRQSVFPFDPFLRLMSTIDHQEGEHWINSKGAPAELLERCDSAVGQSGETVPLTPAIRRQIVGEADALAARGLRVLGVARTPVDAAVVLPAPREEMESELRFVGLVALVDPPRQEVPGAVASCKAAGIRTIVITGDHALTAAAVARQVGIVGDAPRILLGRDVDAMSDLDLDDTLRSAEEILVARASPEAKLRVADALRAEGHVVAMTGDGVNDAPALRKADIGIAMGRSGTEVAREAAEIVLTDDNFATIVAAIEEGRAVYQNIRKFILYIFAHTTPEVVPFLLFALSGGSIPLALTALQILAIDLGTETLPALALGRDPAEPGLMKREPRKRSEGIITKAILWRAWGVMGLVSAALVVGGFFFALLTAGWRPGDAVGAGSPHHDAYLAATTMTFLGIVACQIGTAFAARTEIESTGKLGLGSNPLLLAGIVFEVAFAAAIVALPPLQPIFGTRPPALHALLILPAFPVIVWAVDEARRWRLRRKRRAVDMPGTA